jgi:hypothetical protein
MTGDAIVTMAIAMVLIWGGLAASIVHALRAHRAQRVRDPKSAADG